MRLFISYARAHRELAAVLAARLREEGHHVFFDVAALQPGEAFDAKIRTAIAASDLLVFLIGPDAIADGSYARAELSIAESLWPTASRRVLPVMVEPTPIAELPAYIRGITMLQPAGEFAAETLHAVARVARKQRLRRISVAVGLGALLAGGGAAAVWLRETPELLEQLSISRVRADHFDGGDMFAVEARFAGATSPRRLENISLGTDMPGWYAELEADAPVFLEGPVATIVRWSLRVRNANGAPAAEGAIPPLHVRLCWEEASVPGCGRWLAFEPVGERRRPVSPVAGLSAAPGAVIATRAGFVVADLGAGRLDLVDPTGARSTASRLLGAEIASLDAADELALVGLSAPASLWELDAETLQTRAVHTMRPIELEGMGLSSVRPRSAARREGTWLITGGDGHIPDLLHAQAAGRPPEHVSYIDGFDSDVDGAVLRTNGRDLWAVRTHVMPVSLDRLQPREHLAISGHEHPETSCFGDMVVKADGHLLGLDCEGAVVEVAVEGTTVRLVNRWTSASPNEATRDLREEQQLCLSHEILWASISTRVRADDHPVRWRLVRHDLAERQSRVAIEVAGAAALGFAVRDDVAVAVMLREGRREAVRVTLGSL